MQWADGEEVVYGYDFVVSFASVGWLLRVVRQRRRHRFFVGYVLKCSTVSRVVLFMLWIGELRLYFFGGNLLFLLPFHSVK